MWILGIIRLVLPNPSPTPRRHWNNYFNLVVYSSFVKGQRRYIWLFMVEEEEGKKLPIFFNIYTNPQPHSCSNTLLSDSHFSTLCMTISSQVTPIAISLWQDNNWVMKNHRVLLLWLWSVLAEGGEGGRWLFSGTHISSEPMSYLPRRSCECKIKLHFHHLNLWLNYGVFRFLLFCFHHFRKSCFLFLCSSQQLHCNEI